MDETLIGTVFASTLRVATPLIFCAMAGTLAERSGVIDLGLEGKMLASAFAAAAAGAATGSPFIAVMAALAIAIALSWVHGFACVSHSGDQVVSGMAINMVVAGLTVVLSIALFKMGGNTPALEGPLRATPLWPGASATLGIFLGEGIFGHNLFVYLALACVGLVWFMLYRTRFGLRLRAVGENPHMVDAAGVPVKRLRYAALTINGVLCAFAGMYLVMAQSAAFAPNMTAGRGYMALAAMIFGNWRPLHALGACLLFGFLDAVSIRLQGVVLPGIGEVPVQAVQALPYLLTVFLLAGFIGRAIAPRALGRPYVKDR